MKRAVRAILRLIASGLILFGGLEIGLEFTRHRMQKAEINPWHFLIGVILIGLGAFLCAASAALAERLTDDLEE